MRKDDKSIRVIFTPSGRRGTARRGQKLLGVARELGVDIDSACGGRAICGRCQVRVAEGDFPREGIRSRAGHLSGISEAERRHGELRELPEGHRLACQARILDDVVIDVPPESQIHRQLVRKAADDRAIPIDPLIRPLLVEVEPPDMANPESDFTRLARAVEEEWHISGLRADTAVLTDLQAALRAGDWRVTVLIHQAREESAPLLIGVRPGFDETLTGLAVDIGSTTIAAHLTDLHSGEVLATAGAMNPQIRFGEDLMSRVSHAMMEPEGTRQMRDAVRAAINALAAEVAARAGLEARDILDVTLAGNPVMHHLLLGINPRELGQAPFALAVDEALEPRAADIGLSLAPAARAYVLPCVAGHVGADAAAVALAEAPHESEEMSLIIDIGTNAEIFLGNRRRILACSSPTGPAFEGAQIFSGQRAAPGAIERVRIDRKTLRARYKVIGCEPWSDAEGFEEAVSATGVSGICGSGIVEAVAEMYLSGIIDASGRFRQEAADNGGPLRRRGRSLVYVLRAGEPEILVTQEDVRAVQLAKAALLAGVRLLMDEMGTREVARIRLAGAFGNHIDPLYAMILGMIPDCPLERVQAAGNAAGTGARMALTSRAARREVETLVRRMEKIETALAARFQEHFVQAMGFPLAGGGWENLEKAVRLPRPSGQPRPAGRRRRRKTNPKTGGDAKS